MEGNEIRVEKLGHSILIYCNDKFIGAIENTSASCAVIDLLIEEIRSYQDFIATEQC